MSRPRNQHSLPETVTLPESGRLDRVLSRGLPVSRSRVQDWIREGRVSLGGEVIRKKSRTVQAGDRVHLSYPEDPEPEQVEPEEEPLEVVYEDRDVLAVNKPTGLVVHPYPGQMTGTLVNRLIHHYPGIQGIGESPRWGLVHRLDRGTSGVLLVARNESVLADLQDQFRNREVEKSYRAILTGVLEDERVRVEVPVARHPTNPTLRAVAPEGKHAVTRLERAGFGPDATAVWCRPRTGRTHQLRVHCKHLGHAVVGDEKYGGAKAGRLMLHAEEIAFDHPRTGKRHRISVQPEDELRDRWEHLVEST